MTSEVTGQEVEDEELAAVTTIAQAEALVVFDRLLGTRADPLRDPELDPLRARQYDMSVSWYPNPDTFLQAAVFYKDIRDFIFELGGVEDPEDLAEFGIDVDRIRAESNVPLRDVEFTTFTNGDAAEVYGLELTYAQAYTFLPAPFNGLFSYANVTFADSEANERFVDRTFTLPEQADVVGNISLGYENDRFTVRWSGNYVGERLRVLNEGRLGLDFEESDLYEASRWSMDVNGRWNVSDSTQIYFDAININDAEDQTFFKTGGQNGTVLGVNENYGATYQTGARIRY